MMWVRCLFWTIEHRDLRKTMREKVSEVLENVMCPSFLTNLIRKIK